MEVIIKNKIEELLSKEFYCSSDENELPRSKLRGIEGCNLYI